MAREVPCKHEFLVVGSRKRFQRTLEMGNPGCCDLDYTTNHLETAV